MGFQTTLLTAAAEYLHAENVGNWNLLPYREDDVAITIDVHPTTPDKAIALGLYPVNDDGSGTDSTIGLQLRIRGAPKDRISVKDIADRAFDALHGLTNTSLGGIPIVLIYRMSGASLGADGNGRQEITANYYIRCTRTGAHRTD